MEKTELFFIEFVSPGESFLPVVKGGFETGFGGIKAVQVLVFPGGIVKICVSLVPLVSQEKVLLREFNVYVHHKKITVLFPLCFVLYKGDSVEGIAEVGLEGFFEPVNILHCVIRVLVIMKMKESIVLLFIGYKVGVKRQTRDQGKKGQ